MTSSSTRPGTALLCILLMICQAAWTGCTVSVSGGGGGGGSGGNNGGAGGGGANALTLSSSSVMPGELLKVSHQGITSGSMVEVVLSHASGYEVVAEGVDTQAGSTRIAAPPVVDLDTDSIAAGQFAVSIRGLSGEATLLVEDLPLVEGLEPGTLVAFYLQTAMDELLLARSDLAQIEAEFPDAVTDDSSLDLIDEQIADLQDTIFRLDNGLPITVDLPDNLGEVTLTSADLEMADRWLAGTLNGLQQEALGGTNAIDRLSLRTVSECLELAKQGGDSAVSAVTDCFGEVVGDVRISTGRGTNLAMMLASGVGLVVAIKFSGAVAVVGGVVFVIGGVASFTNAAVLGENTDAFLNNDGEGFNAGQEIFSQVIRYGTNFATNIAVQGTGLVLTVKDILVGAKTEKCLSEQQERRQQPMSDVAAFCAFDPSDPINDPGDGQEPTANGPFTITIVSTTDGNITSDPSAAQISLSGSTSFPTISWTVGSLQQLNVVEAEGGSGAFLYAVLNRVADDENGDTMIIPISPPLTYGDYSRNDVMRLEGPGLNLPGVAPALRSDGTTYTVNVVTSDGQTSSIGFTIN